MVPPNGPAVARSTSTWIHWWSPVASAKRVHPAPGRSPASRWCRAPGRSGRRARRGRRGRACRGPRARRVVGLADRGMAEPAARPEPIVPTRDQIRGPPRCCCTTTSTAGCARRRCSSSPTRSGTTLPAQRRGVARPLVRRVGRLRLAGALPRDLRPHRRGDADRGGDRAGRPRVRRRPRRRRRRVRRGPLRPRAARRRGPDPRPGRRPRCRSGFEAGMADAGGRIVVRQLLTAMRHQARSREIAELAVAWRDAGRRRASTSPAPRRASRRPGTSTRSSTSSARTSTSPSTPARPSGCRRSGRRSSGAAPTGSATASGSSTTSPSTTTASPSSAGSRRTCATSGSRSSSRPASNVQTGAAASIAEHPIGLLTDAALPGHRQHRQPADEPDLDDRRDGRAGARRSATTCDDLRWFTINAMKSAFLPFDERLAIIDERHQAGVRRAAGLTTNQGTSHPESPSRACVQAASGTRTSRPLAG